MSDLMTARLSVLTVLAHHLLIVPASAQRAVADAVRAAALHSPHAVTQTLVEHGVLHAGDERAREIAEQLCAAVAV